MRAQRDSTTRCLGFVASARMVERRILFVRDEKVRIDSDIADLYEVPTKRLNEAVSRNLDRFPLDFMFQLTREEMESLRSRIATSKAGRGGSMTLWIRSEGMSFGKITSKPRAFLNLQISRFVLLRSQSER